MLWQVVLLKFKLYEPPLRVVISTECECAGGEYLFISTSGYWIFQARYIFQLKDKLNKNYECVSGSPASTSHIMMSFICPLLLDVSTHNMLHVSHWY